MQHNYKKGRTMKKKVGLIFVGIALLFGFQTAVAEQASKQVVDLGNSAIAAFGTDPVLVRAVKQENARTKTLDQIKALDQRWVNTPGIADFMKGVLSNATADYLKDIQKQEVYYAEIFLMDNQGALVASTDKTSDYWQGDEAKFKHPFSTGTIHVSDVEFDTSAQAYLVQISVPIKDGNAVIGAITFGLNLDEFK
jgi:cell fate (sporulation/competence/biofilm development) regulator YmcA (YheA/YmcA/DUF963 family)